MIFEVRELPYDGSNLKLLGLIHNSENNLYRAAEKSDYKKILKYGTVTLNEDVIFAATADDIIAAENNLELSSFKQFKNYKEPILIVYDVNGFEKLNNSQWKFKDTKNKRKYLKQFIFIKTQ